jgi:carbon monoxide dehydrogenase subunit G
MVEHEADRTGLAQGAARIRLEDDRAGGTLLSFAADGRADGGIMRLGRALIGKSAQRVIDGFFESIGREMGAIVTALPPQAAPPRF